MRHLPIDKYYHTNHYTDKTDKCAAHHPASTDPLFSLNFPPFLACYPIWLNFVFDI